MTKIKKGLSFVFCEKCGIPVEDGQKLCASCAAEESYVPDERPEYIELNCEGSTECPKSGNGKLIALIAGIAAVIVILALVLWKPISGLFAEKPEFETAQEHFTYVESQNVASVAGSLSSSYGNLLANFHKQATGIEADVKLDFNDELMRMLSQLADEDLAWLDDLSLNVRASGQDYVTQMLMSISMGDTVIMDADIGADYATGAMWYGFPMLSDTYLGMDTAESEMDVEMMESLLVELSRFMTYLPDEQVLNSILERYLIVAISSIQNVERHDVTIKAGNLSQKCTALEVTLDGEALGNMLVAILETAKNDQELINVVEQVAEGYMPGVGTMLAGSWEETIDDLIDAYSSPSQWADMDTLILIDYVDSKNHLIGREIRDVESGEAFHYWTVTKGTDFVFEADLSGLVITGVGTDAMGVIDAEYNIEADGEELISFDVIDLNSIQWDRGEFCGTLRIHFPRDALSDTTGMGIPLKLAMDIKLDTATAGSGICVELLISGETLLSLTMKCKEIEPFKVTVPDDMVVASDEEAINDWLLTLDIAKIRDNLEKAGVPKEYLEAFNALPVDVA